MVSNRKRVPYSKAVEQLADDKGELYSSYQGFSLSLFSLAENQYPIGHFVS